MNPFEDADVVAFELSNRCIYAEKHIRCPVGLNKELILLPTKEIIEIFGCMGYYNYNKIVQFSIYNEPMHDPRLFMLIGKLLKHCPDVYVDILTNGWYLNQQLLNDMSTLGVSSVRVTAYNTEEYSRLSKLVGNDIFYGCGMGNLDDRLCTYDRIGVDNIAVCIMPEKYIFINNDLTVGMCCMDFKHQYVFGSLLEDSLENILLSERRKQLISELNRGVRTLDFCKKCYFVCGAPEIAQFYSIRGK